MFRLTIKELLAKKMRLLSTAMAVLLGIAFLADGRIVDAIDQPTADTVIDRIKSLGG